MRTLFVFILLFGSVSYAQEDLELQEIEQELLENAQSRQYHSDKWAVDEAKIDIEDEMFKRGVDRDLTDWNNLEVDKWVDIKQWIQEREIKDQNPKWRSIVRNSLNKEVMGRVIKCIGVCSYYHGLSSTTASFQTILREGDEFITEKDSTAWIVMTDGSLVRVSPKTSITFTEINISREKIFFLVRLNNGHLSWQNRLKGEFEALDKAETDMGFLPLMIKNANREYYAIREYRQKNEEEKLLFAIEKNPGFTSHYKKLNDYINSEENQALLEKDTELYLYSPNVSLVLKNTNASLFYAVNGESHLKVSKDIPNFKRDDKREQSVVALMRGYENNQTKEVPFDKWVSVDRLGKNIKPTKVTNQLETLESFLLRIPTIQLAREHFIQKHSKELLDPKTMPERIISRHEFRVWDIEEQDESKRRLAFIKEYIRRVETTNLINLGKIYRKDILDPLDQSYYANPMKLHYNKVRLEYTRSHQAVREMTDNEYYLWMIRND